MLIGTTRFITIHSNGSACPVMKVNREDNALGVNGQVSFWGPCSWRVG